jgi:hypothetical protein
MRRNGAVARRRRHRSLHAEGGLRRGHPLSAPITRKGRSCGTGHLRRRRYRPADRRRDQRLRSNTVAPDPGHRLAQVFVVGSAPTITYARREEHLLEDRVADYVEERGRILVVTGPSKSGKTVLLTRTLSDAVWVAGGRIREPDNLWRLAVDAAGGWTGDVREHARTDTESTSAGTTAQFKPMGVGADRRSRMRPQSRTRVVTNARLSAIPSASSIRY